MKKNILFLFPDQHRGDWLPFNQNISDQVSESDIPLKMDNIRMLMENGTTFTRAITTSPLCVPARASLASGMDYDNCKVYNNDFCYPLTQKTFYSVLKDGGYNVGGVGKFDFHKPILYWGKDGWIDQLSDFGFSHAIDSEGKYDLLWSSFYTPKGPYSNFLHENGLFKTHAEDYIRRYYNTNDVNPTSLPDYAYSDNWVTKNAVDILDKLIKEEEPWFMMVNFPGPHNPWDVTQEMKQRWKNVNFPLPIGYDGNVSEMNEVRQNYAAMLENIDMNIGLIIEKLKEEDLLENTLIVYCSDHGEMLGDKNRFFKSVPYQGSVHIPLVISGPGIAKGETTDALVQLNDLAATFIEFSGLSMMKGTDSISLLPLTKGDTKEHRTHQVCGLYNSMKSKGYPEYSELLQHCKTKSDSEYIEEFNREFGLQSTENSAKKQDYYKDWKCVITKKHKLIVYSDETCELYDLISDPWEMKNIADEQPNITAELKMKLN